ncbi:restriction endonuclease subunit S [Geobacillus stearothermophilus]|nr:restriction endonuclease subunit S [Geobacillus stearothermophilus]
MNEWKEVRLGEVVQINPESLTKDYPFNVIDYIDISSVGTGELRETTQYPISEAPSRAKRLVRAGDTILSTVRPNRRSFLYLKKPKENQVVSTGFAVLRATEKINSRYLYYLISDQKFTDYLVSQEQGAAYPAVSIDSIKNAIVLLPDLETQEKIASILGSIDDKIELNVEMNKTLEEMAMTLYKHWFVDFGPFQDGEFVESELGMIPKGWEIKKLSDIVEIRTTSINPSKTPGEFYYHYSIPAYDEGKLPLLNSAESIKSNKYLIETDTVLVSKLNPATPRIWTVYFKKESKNKQITSTEFIHYVPKQNINFAWLNCYLRSDDFQNEFKSNATGTTHSRQRVSPKVTKNFLVVIPPFDVMASFNNKVSSYFKLIDQNLKSITLLSETRDYLIPRLLSGEIDVSKAEKQVEEVL